MIASQELALGGELYATYNKKGPLWKGAEPLQSHVVGKSLDEHLWENPLNMG